MARKIQYFRGRWSFQLMQALSDMKALMQAERKTLLPALEAVQNGLTANFDTFLESPNAQLPDGEKMREAAGILITSPKTDAELRGLVAMLLISDSLIEVRPEDMLTYLWEMYRKQLECLPAPLRAAVMNGIKQLKQLNLAEIEPDVDPLHCLSQTREAVCEPLCEMAKAASEEELLNVSHGDYGKDVQKYFAALKCVIRKQNCIFYSDQNRHPREVVDLAALSPQSSEGQWCTALMLLDAIAGRDIDGSLEYRWEKFARDYMRYSTLVKHKIITGFRYLYEQDDNWEPYATWSDRQYAHRGLVIPHLSA